MDHNPGAGNWITVITERSIWTHFDRLMTKLWLTVYDFLTCHFKKRKKVMFLNPKNVKYVFSKTDFRRPMILMLSLSASKSEREQGWIICSEFLVASGHETWTHVHIWASGPYVGVMRVSEHPPAELPFCKNIHFKILKAIATSGFLTAVECTKFVFDRGSPRPPIWFKGDLTSKTGGEVGERKENRGGASWIRSCSAWSIQRPSVDSCILPCWASPLLPGPD